jgi:Rad3-related DNA helicase
VFTSATLAVNGSFEHFQTQLGIEDCNEIQVDSPFDYKKNAMLYLPTDVPLPNDPGFDAAVLRVVLVVIDKLPFASPGDPVLQARIRGMRNNGVNPFVEYQLPKAVLMLKQGVGRLIRDVSDRGVLVICDPRLKTKEYGSTFINSLPGMRIVQKQISVGNFFKAETEEE